MEEDDDSSSLSSFISIGTAEVRPISRLNSSGDDIVALPTPIAAATTARPNQTLTELVDLHRRRPVPALTPVLIHFSSRSSKDTMEQLKENRGKTENCNSIIAPSSVKISFSGNLTDMPVVLPLEEGLQKLYKLYQENDPSASDLPRDIQITDVPLSIIAESLASHINELRSVLTDCATNIEALNLTNDQTKKDLINLEYEYCLARQEANMSRMSTDDVKLRLAWAMEEIARVNTEKEVALAANIEYNKDLAKLKKEVEKVEKAKMENKKLKKCFREQERRVTELQGQLDEARKCLDSARFALSSVPGPIQKLCEKVLVPPQEEQAAGDGGEKGGETEEPDDKKKEKEKKESKRRRLSRSLF